MGGAPLSEDDLRQEVADVIDVARRLWDSWEDDAVIRDLASGRFLDAGRVHHVDFTGARFSVAGPLITPRPPQGQVGVTDRLDVALIDAPDLASLRQRAARARADGAPLVFAESKAGGRTAAQLRELLGRLEDIVDGVRLHPADLTTDLPPIVEALGARPQAGPTLRETLGLPRPANRFATAR